jgi:hypothetical protein
MDKNIKQDVFRQVQKCMMSLVGGSGHLTSYSILSSTFKITGIEEIQGDLKKYSFEVKGYRESEFTVYDDAHPSEADHLSGSIVLDKVLQLARDEKGRVMLEPWTCSD